MSLLRRETGSMLSEVHLGSRDERESGEKMKWFE